MQERSIFWQMHSYDMRIGGRLTSYTFLAETKNVVPKILFTRKAMYFLFVEGHIYLGYIVSKT